MFFRFNEKVSQQDRSKVLSDFRNDPTIQNKQLLLPKSSNVNKTVLDKGNW